MAEDTASSEGRSKNAVSIGGHVYDDADTVGMIADAEFKFIMAKLKAHKLKENDANSSEAEDDRDVCPICLEPLAPFWDRDYRVGMGW